MAAAGSLARAAPRLSAAPRQPLRRRACRAPCAASAARAAKANMGGFTAAVTGSNRGIGLEFVRQLAEREDAASVVAGCRDPQSDACAALRELAAAHGSVVTLVPLDVTDPASVEAFAAKTAELVGGHLDLLLNNAGTTGTDGYTKWTLEDFEGDAAALQAELEYVHKINTAGPLMVAQQLLWNGALGGDKERRSVIGNVTSKVGSCDDNGSGRGYAYRASKAALNVASVSLSIDYRDQNVATVLLHPGWVRTRMTEGRGLIDADESARGLLEVCSWPSEKISGRWYDYKFEEVPW